MTTPNAPTGADDDPLIRRATALSRFARRLLAAEPGLLPAASLARPFTADEMRAHLAAATVAGDATLQRALRDLRKRVILRIIARDLGGVLGTGGHCTMIRRTAVGAFTIDQAVPMDAVPEVITQEWLAALQAPPT